MRRTRSHDVVLPAVVARSPNRYVFGCCCILGLVPSLAVHLQSQPSRRWYTASESAPAVWRTASAPTIEIGGVEGVSGADFTGIVGVTKLSDGRLVVADRATRQLRIFDPVGRFRAVLTRQGGGPRELRELDLMVAVGDTLIAVDGRTAVHIVVPADSHFRSLRLPTVARFIVNPAVGATSASEVLVILRSGAGTETSLALRLDSIWFGRVSTIDSSVKIVGSQRTAASYPLEVGHRAIYAVGFTAHPHIATGSGRFCTGYPAVYLVSCHDSHGRLLFEVHREFRPRPVTDSARRAFRASIAGFSDGASRFRGSLARHRQRVAAAARFAATYPAYSQLLLSRTGELWVRAYATEDGLTLDRWRTNAAPSHWSIYDRSGRWIADCTLPARFAPAEIGPHYVVGVSRDIDGIERVTMLRLRR